MKYLVAALSCACLSLAHAGELQSHPARPAALRPDATSLQRARIAVGKLPLSFEPNRGQTDSRVDFIARGRGYTLFLSPGSATFSLTNNANGPGGSTAEQSVIRMNVLGAHIRAPLAGEDRLPGTANYLFDHGGGAPLTGLPTFAKTRASQIYPAIDLLYYGTDGRLEYDFVVAPHADPRQIRLGFEGAEPAIAANGDLLLRQPGARHGAAAGHAVRLQKPVIYQDIGAYRVPVHGRFALAANRTVRFEVGRYDPTQALIIDPVVVYSSYIGGSTNSTEPNGLAVNAAGEIYLTGGTNSLSFPTTPGVVFSACPATHCAPSPQSAFVTKVAANGESLIYSTYLGGSGSGSGGSGPDYGTGIAVDANDEAWVVGSTGSDNFPITRDAFEVYCSPYYNSGSSHEASGCGGGALSAFIVKLNPTGATILYGTFLGGTQGTTPGPIALDTAGNVYVAGTATNIDLGGTDGQYSLPTTSTAFQPQPATGSPALSAFVSELSADGHTLVYSTFYAGVGGQTYGTALAVNAGKIFVGGYTQSPNITTTAGALSSSCYGNPSQCPGSGWVAEFDPTKSGSASLVFATYVDTKGTFIANANPLYSAVTALAADSSGNVYLGGSDNFTNFPTTAGSLQPTCNPTYITFCETAFIMKLNSAGALVWSTFYGSPSGATSTFGISGLALDASNNVYFDAYAPGGSDVPTVGSLYPYNGAGAVVGELSADGSHLIFGTFYGGASLVQPKGIALDSAGNIYFAGYVGGADLPLVNPYLSTDAGGYQDGFFAKISTQPIASSVAVVVTPATAKVGAAVQLTATVKGASGQPTPTGTVTFKSGTTTLGAATLSSTTGVGTLTTTTLAAGSYSVVASYSGNAVYATSVSAAEPLTIQAPTPAPTVTLAATPTSLALGASSTLSWTTTNAASCVASGGWTGAEATSGTAAEKPAAAGTASYTLTCTGTGGSAAATATVTVKAPAPTVTIAASPTSLTLGSSSTLTWSSTNATACTASGGWTGAEATSGTLSETPSAAGSATYTLTCTGTGGSATASATIMATAKPATGGGGGAFDWLSIAGLAGLGLVGMRRRAPR
jgi:hypothetical protein